jgi:hypothetical protein
VPGWIPPRDPDHSLLLTYQPITTMRKKKPRATYNNQLNSVLGISSDNNVIKSMAISLVSFFQPLICGMDGIVNQDGHALFHKMVLLYISTHDDH